MRNGESSTNEEASAHVAADRLLQSSLMKRKVGRPVGWRKPNAYRKISMIRLTEEQWRWGQEQARIEECSVSEVVRRAIDRARSIKMKGRPRS